MNFFREIAEIKKIFLPWIYIFLIILIFFAGFNFTKFSIGSVKLYLPIPNTHPLAADFLIHIQKDLLPKDVSLIATNPLSGFLAQIVIALALAFLLTLPFLLYRFLRYFLPAFYENERKIFLLVLFPSIVLFMGGCVFAYFLLIPATLKILYSYTFAVNAIAFFSINEFIAFFFGLTIGTGLLFLIPVVMFLLSYFNAVKADFWLANWRYAFLIFIILSAIITPDGSGVTMIIMSIPLTVLYFLGFFASKIIQGPKKTL